MKNQTKTEAVTFKHLHVNLKLHFPHNNISLIFQKRQVSFTLPWMCFHCSRRDRPCVSFCSQWMFGANKSHMFRWLRCAFGFCLWWSALCLADCPTQSATKQHLWHPQVHHFRWRIHTSKQTEASCHRSNSVGVDGDSSCDPQHFKH